MVALGTGFVIIVVVLWFMIGGSVFNSLASATVEWYEIDPNKPRINLTSEEKAYYDRKLQIALNELKLVQRDGHVPIEIQIDNALELERMREAAGIPSEMCLGACGPLYDENGTLYSNWREINTTLNANLTN